MNELTTDKEKILSLLKITELSQSGVKTHIAKNAISQAAYWLKLALKDM